MATLLGGARDRIPAYASLGEVRPPEQRAQDAHALVQDGFRAVKVRIARERIAEGIAMVAAMRDAVGDDLQIMVDLNQWWRMAGDIAPGLGPQGARRVIDALAGLGVLWVEEPLAGDDLDGMRMLRQATGTRIAGGEMARTFDELRRALERDALDVVQPDVVLALGISGARTLADLALRRNRWFTPHTWTNGIGLAGQPARLLWGRRRPVPRVSLRPTGLDAGAARLHARRSRWRSTRTAAWRSASPRPGDRARRGRGGPLRRGGDGASAAHDAGTPAPTRVAFIGLGHMGGHMCRNVITAGFDVAAYDLDAEALAHAARDGARPSDGVAGCVRDAEIVITSLPGPPQVHDVLCGPGRDRRPGPRRADHRDEHQLAGGRAARAGAARAAPASRCIDAPVAGQTIGAEAGTLAIYVGGEAERVRPRPAGARRRSATRSGSFTSGPAAAATRSSSCST